jgi:hypothetical protein
MQPMQPYAPPQAHVAPSTNPDVDIADASTPLIAKGAGGLVGFAGVNFTLMALQTLAVVNIYGFMKVMPYLILAAGIGLLVAGVSIFRAQGWAPIAAIVVGAIGLLVSCVWLVFSFANGLFGLFALGAPALALASIIAGALTMGPCKKASDARARLAAAGLGFGI